MFNERLVVDLLITMTRTTTITNLFINFFLYVKVDRYKVF